MEIVRHAGDVVAEGGVVDYNAKDGEGGLAGGAGGGEEVYWYWNGCVFVVGFGVNGVVIVVEALKNVVAEVEAGVLVVHCEAGEGEVSYVFVGLYFRFYLASGTHGSAIRCAMVKVG